MSKLEQRQNGISRAEKSALKDRLKGFLMFLPNLAALMGKLIRDARVPLAEKALFLAAVIYVISPLDLIPDMFPFIGQVDDLYVVALTLLRLLQKTDESIVREHWNGGGDIVALASSIAALAPTFLPKRVTKILTAQVEMAPADQLVSAVQNGKGAVVRVTSGQIDAPKE